MGIVEMIREREINAIRKEAIQETKIEFVKNLLSSTKHTITEISNLVSVNKYFVKKTKKALK